MKKLIFLLLISCYQLSAEKVFDCYVTPSNLQECKILNNEKLGKNDGVKFQLTKSKEVKEEIEESNITHIDFLNNRMEYLDLASLFSVFPNLENLAAESLHMKKIKPGSFKNAGNLKVLNLEDHHIKTLEANSFDGLSKLKTLILFEGSLVKIDPSAFTCLGELRSLLIGKNRIKTIAPETFEKLVNLKTLDLEKNLIEELHENTFKNLVKLQYIGLSSNNLKTLPPTLFQNNLILNYVELPGNNLKMIPENMFSHLSQLKFLRLEANECIDVTYTSANTKFPEVKENLSATCNLDPALNVAEYPSPPSSSWDLECTLAITENYPCVIRDATVRINDEVKFHLSESYVDDPKYKAYKYVDIELEGFKRLAAKRLLKLTSALIDEVEFLDSVVLTIPTTLFTTFENLRGLTLESGVRTIKPKTFIGAKKLSTLNLAYHHIRRLEANSFEGLEKLMTLKLSDGSLSQIDSAAFNGLDNLMYLYLSRNKIKAISPETIQNLKNLRRISLEFNAINQLDGDLLANLEKLESFRFDDNDLETLPENLFKNNKKLEYVDLDRNNLKEIPRKIFKNLELHHVGLASNVCIDKSYSPSFYDKDVTKMNIAIEKDLAEHCDNEVED